MHLEFACKESYQDIMRTLRGWHVSVKTDKGFSFVGKIDGIDSNGDLLIRVFSQHSNIYSPTKAVTPTEIVVI